MRDYDETLPKIPIKKKKEVVLVKGDDWEGIYINGRLIFENHSLSAKEIFRILGFDIIDVDDQWLGDRGSFPENISEVKKEEKNKMNKI